MRCARRAARVGVLSVEQALADYAILIRHIRARMGVSAAPVITFGGSLAGSLFVFSFSVEQVQPHVERWSRWRRGEAT